MELSSIFTMAAYGVGYLSAGLFALSALRSTFFTSQQQQETLVTRFGKHIRTIKEPGLRVKIPFIDKIAKRIGMDLCQTTETLKTKTKDDLFTDLPIAIQYQITDSARFYFQNRDAVENMKKVVSAAVRTVCAGKDFQELFGDRETISDHVIDATAAKVREYGLTIRRIVIDEPSVSSDVKKQFDEVKASERAKEAARNRAEAHRIEVVTKSEADAQAQANAGKGAADFRRAILDGYKSQIEELTHDGKVSKEEALHIVMRSMELDALREVAQKGNLVIVPQTLTSDNTGNLAEVNTLRTLLEKNRVANDTGGTGVSPAVPLSGPGM